MPPYCTPQGSPLSPILSALFISSMLKLTSMWEHSDLTLYVDDGCIFALSSTFGAVTARIQTAAHDVRRALQNLGLSINTDKTEIIFFHPPRCSKHQGAPLTTVSISFSDT